MSIIKFYFPLQYCYDLRPDSPVHNKSNMFYVCTSNKEFCETFSIYPNQGIFFKSLKVCKNVQLQTVRNEICANEKKNQ